MEENMSASPVPAPPPKLRHGERLSRTEFERRYEAMPNVKAELLDGVVYVMSSPVSTDHGSPHFKFSSWLGYYEAHTPGVEGGDNTTTRLSDNNDVQPDVYLRILETHGGVSHIDEDRYVAGAPELIGEVARSSASYDRTVKMPIYRRDGVREFILWRVADNAIEWFILRGSDYQLLTPGDDGILRSETFPGLWLDVEAMLRLDGAAVFRALQLGIDSREHARFVEQLSQRAGQPKSD
jgi:Uma2 family endonuclease